MTEHSATRTVPVGFRFHPTDEELVGYYLPKKVHAHEIDLDLIRDLDLYKLEPWDLQELCKIQAHTNEKQTDYYFFSRKDKKYPTGNRANRATTKGFWKATGRDKPIYTKLQTLIGMRKTLVFYEGRAPHGVKTDWIMHEFRLDDGPGMPAHEDGGWVVCRVFKKNKNFKIKTHERACSFEEQIGLLPEMGSPDILSRGPSGSYAFINNASAVKQEFINLEEYNPCVDQYLNPISQLAMNKIESHSMPSASNFKSLLQRSVSKKDPDYLIDPYENSLSVFNEPRGSENQDEGFCGLEGLDWNAFYEAPGKDLRFPSTAKIDPSLGDAAFLRQLKRQNSDMFSSLSSLDVWNYSQVSQQK